MPSWVVLGPGDDAAVIQPERGAFDVLTTDAQVDGVHFDRRFVPAEAIGHRALAVNLSDLAAMGASPRAALLSLALPATLDVETFDQMLRRAACPRRRAHGVSSIGGNITHTPGPLMLDVTAIGAVRPRRLLTRAGARPAMRCTSPARWAMRPWACRRLQDGLSDWSRPRPTDPCVERYLRPEPRVRAGMLLGRNRAASSCMDVSDGLADCVRQVAEASGVGITLDAAAIPVTRGRQRLAGRGKDASPLEPALSGGDDYELFFTVRPAHRGRLRAVCQQLGDLPITRIGVVTKARDLLLRMSDGTHELPAGYEHFK